MFDFRMADVLTGSLVGSLAPNAWSWSDPLTGQASGTLTVPLPRDERARDHLRSTIGQRDRVQVVVWDTDADRYLFGGPVPTPAVYDGKGALAVKFTDWRAWFYSVRLRSGAVHLDVNGDYLRTNYEQTTAMWELALAATSSDAGMPVPLVGVPEFVMDPPEASGIDREITYRRFEAVGAALDSLSRRERGPEWWTSIQEAGSSGVRPVFHVGWPERSTTPESTLPNLRIEDRGIRIEDRGAFGNNVAGRITWPEQPAPINRVYATGEGVHPDQVWAVDTDPSVAGGTALLREDVAGPYTGVIDVATAFEHAFARRSALNAAVPVQVDLRTDRPDVALSEYDVGDRANLLFEDDWQRREAQRARIIKRDISGGRGVPTLAKLVVDVGGQETSEV